MSDTEANGLALQSTLPALCQNELVPAVEQALDRCSPATGNLRIEKLEVDLGAISLEQSESAWAGAITEAVEKSIREQIQWIPTQTINTGTANGKITEVIENSMSDQARWRWIRSHTNNAEAPKSEITEAVVNSMSDQVRWIPRHTNNSEAANSESIEVDKKSIRDQVRGIQTSRISTEAADNVQYRTDSQTINEALIHFLQTGRLPWSFQPPEGVSLEQVLLESWQSSMSRNMPFEVKKLLLTTLKSPVARQRLIQQFSPAFLHALLQALSDVNHANVQVILSKLQQEDSHPSDQRYVRLLFQAAFEDASVAHDSTPASLVQSAWRNLPATAQSALAKRITQHWPEITQDDSQLNTQVNYVPVASLAKQTATSVVNAHEAEVAEGIYIDNAGLVLLHPFLPQFFTTLGIAAGGELTQPERALCLLHYLATGQTFAPEYALTLPKVLCNVPLEVPVEADVLLSERELSEAGVLLSAVIQHWEALKNTSADGLRGAFLNRAGKISLQGEGDWLLQVETQTSDILLDQLPWGISMFKLPWMERMMRVEWR